MIADIADPLNSINHAMSLKEEAVELSKRGRASLLLNRNLSAMSLQDMDNDDDDGDNEDANENNSIDEDSDADDAPQDFEYLEDKATKDKHIKSNDKSVKKGTVSDDTAKTSLSPRSQLKDAKFHDALSTTEFLLSLPLVGGKLPHERADDLHHQNSCGDSLSSLGSSIMLGESDFPTTNADDRSLTCSNRLKLSMRSITRTNSGHDLAFASLNNSKRSLASKISLGSRKSLSSKRSLGNNFSSDNSASNNKPRIHRSNTADLALNMIHKNHKSFTGGLALKDDDNEAQKLNGNACKGSINFPLKRSLSTGNRFQRTASSRSISSTDRLHQSLAKMINQNQQQAKPDCGSVGDEDKVSVAEEATGSSQCKQLSRNNSGRSVSSFLSVDSRRSMRHASARAPRRNERVKVAANSTASPTTVSPRNIMTGEEEDATMMEQNRKNQRKARRRRSLTNIKQAMDLPHQRSSHESISSRRSRSSRTPTEPEPNYVWTSDTKVKKKVNTLLRQLSKGPELARSKSLDSQFLLKHASGRHHQQQAQATAYRRSRGSQSPSRINSLDSGRVDTGAGAIALQAFLQRSNGRGRSPGRGIAPNQSTCLTECKHHLHRSTSLGNTPLGRLTAGLTISSSSVKESFESPMTKLSRTTSLSDRQVKSTAQLLNASVSTMLEESMISNRSSKASPPRRGRAQSEGRRLQQQLQKNHPPTRHGALKSYIAENLISPKKSAVKKDPHSKLAALAALNRSVAGNLETSRSSLSSSRSRSPVRNTQSLLDYEKRSPPRKPNSCLDDRKHSPGRSNSMLDNRKRSPPRKTNSMSNGEIKSPISAPARRELTPRTPQSPPKSQDDMKLPAGAAQNNLKAFGHLSSTGDALDDSSRTSHHSDGDGIHANFMQRLPDMDTSIQRRNRGNYLTMTELDRLMAPMAPSDDDDSHHDSADYSDGEDSYHHDSDDDSYHDSDDSSHDDSDAASSASEETLESISHKVGPMLTSRMEEEEDADINKNTARRAARRRGGAKKEKEEPGGNDVNTGRPKMMRRLSNRDLAAQMNERIPSKKNLLQEIKTIVPFAARKTRNLKRDSKANDKSHFVTGSRIRRFVGGVEVTKGGTFKKCYIK